MRIRIQIQSFYDEKLKKITDEEKIYVFLSKIAIHSCPGLHKGRPSYRRSLQPSKKTSSTF
jgi:hypothetical protein